MSWLVRARYGSLAWRDGGLVGDVDEFAVWASIEQTVEATPTGPTFQIDPLPADEIAAWYAATAWAEADGGGLLASSKPPDDREPWADDAPDDAIF